MSETYLVRFSVPVEITVRIDAEDDDLAADAAWEEAQEFLQTVTGDGRNVSAAGDLDGIGADSVEQVTP